MSVVSPRYCSRLGAVTGVTFGLLLGLSGIQAAAAPPPNPPVPVIEETFVLKHLKPSALVTFLAQGDKTSATPTPVLLPISIRSVTPDDVFNTVTIQGAPEAIAAIRKVALLLDVPPQPVRLTVRIIRYRSAAAQKAGGSGSTPLADVEEVASGTVETTTNRPVELTTYGDRHTFRARLIPHINNAASVTVDADIQMAASDGSFAAFAVTSAGTRLLRIGDRGLITSVGPGILSASPAASPAGPGATKIPGKAAPETYYLEATPSFPPAMKP